MSKYALLLLLACLLSGCGLFRSKMPDHVRYNIGQDDASDWMQGNLDHPKVWAENLHTMMMNSARQPITHAHWALEGTVHSVGAAAAELEALEKEGAQFSVTTTASGRFQLEIMKPASLAGAVTGALGKLVPFSSKEDYLAITLNNVGRAARQLKHDSVPAIERLYFSTVTEIAKVKAGEPLTFDLPEGLTRESYLEVLDAILVAYHNDYEEVQTYQATLASTLPAVAALDSSRRGAVGNIFLVLGAALEDRARFEQARTRLQQFPRSPEAMKEIRAQAATIHAAAVQSPRYRAWVEEPHAWNQLADFGSAVVDAFGSLSEIYAAMGGVDVVGNIQDRVAQGVSIADMLDVGLRLVPHGAKLRGVIEKGKEAYAVAEKVGAVAEKVAEVAADPTAAATEGATSLLLWAASSELDRARRMVTSLPKRDG